MKTIKYSLFSLIIILGCSALIPKPQPKSDQNNSIVALKIFAHGLMSKSYNSYISIQNLSTGKIYKPSYGKQFIYISDVAPGKYILKKMEIPFANMKVELKNDKDTILVPENSILDLGEYDVYFKPGTHITKFEYQILNTDNKENILDDLGTISGLNYSENRYEKNETFIKASFERRNK